MFALCAREEEKKEIGDVRLGHFFRKKKGWDFTPRCLFFFPLSIL